VTLAAGRAIPPKVHLIATTDAPASTYFRLFTLYNAKVQTTVCLCLYGTKVPKENGASGCAIERSMSPPIGQLQLPNMDTLYASPSCAIPLPIATLPAATGISGIKREILGVKPWPLDSLHFCHDGTDTASGVYSSRSTVLRPMCTTMNQSNAPCLSSKQLIASVRTSVGRKTHTSTQFITQTGQSTSSSRG
ncbi:uncharacterized protein CCOS01_01221, partial [Colletotrichum costaricense]